MENPQNILQFILNLVALSTVVTGFAVWMNNQFNKIKDLLFHQIDKQNTKIDALEKSLIEKIEYHERHDDKRFEDVRNSLWEIRLRNAAVEGIVTAAKNNYTEPKKEK